MDAMKKLSILFLFIALPAFAKDTMLRDSCVAYERLMVAMDAQSGTTVNVPASDGVEARFCQGYVNGFIVGTNFPPSSAWDLRNAAKSIVKFEDEFPNDQEPLRQRILKAWVRDGLIISGGKK